ncbi:methionyl-tRNA synthetase [Thraustotheca clavata]|uniref:methionine--tRNA ligase n=1 Tax=Thraustotheca clavata TaxID=74557 RepID=A0A1V9YX34_9STRA|nr:methionyl-tRNA synthetase [Thraustotheca clavata]
MEGLTAKVASLNLKTRASDEAEMAALTQAAKNEKFYLTTAIHYSNGQPHIGHAYENVCSDVIVRYHRVYGRDVRFLTGTDEHGQKIAQTAEAAGMTPQQLCDKYSGLFQQLTKDLNMSNDDFIRTTSDRHKKFCQYIFKRAQDNGDIYKGTYEGWYNVREETFVTENEAAQTNYKDPTSGVPLKKMQEESYFFKMSKYQKRLVEHFHANPDFLQPENARQAILKRLEEPLHDLSASRTTFSHGIPLPDDSKHVMYVWFDALSNYMSALDYPNGPLAKYWPANVHIIGKDITWFHTVIWPCILMSAGFPLPKRVFAHGFINARDGTKMSKSIGNVIDPYDMISKVGLDSFRYFVVRGARFGADMPFSVDELIAMHNSDLADTLGNLVHRGLTLSVKYANGAVPDATATPCFDVSALRTATEEAFQAFNLQDGCIAFIEAVKETNKYLTDAAPWHMTDNKAKLVVVRTVLEAIYIFAHFMTPYMPGTATAIFDKLRTQPKTLTQLSSYFDNLTPGSPIAVGDILFQKVLSDAEKAVLEAKKNPAPAPVKAKVKTEVPLFAACDIRVGTITKVWPHPDSDKLYCEEIDVGLDAPVQIASGLRPFYSQEQVLNRKVIVLLNIKAAKLAGFKSNGMVLCALDDANNAIEFIEPPAGAVNGERVVIATESGDPVSEGQMKKQKIWEKLSVDLKTNGNLEATYKGAVITTSVGPCKAKSLKNVRIA